MLAEVAINAEDRKNRLIAITAGSVGIELFIYLGVLPVIGEWLDRRFATAPWLKWSLAVLGLGAAINALVRLVRQYNKSLKNDDSPPANKPD